MKGNVRDDGSDRDDRRMWAGYTRNTNCLCSSTYSGGPPRRGCLWIINNPRTIWDCRIWAWKVRLHPSLPHDWLLFFPRWAEDNIIFRPAMKTLKFHISISASSSSSWSQWWWSVFICKSKHIPLPYHTIIPNPRGADSDGAAWLFPRTSARLFP